MSSRIREHLRANVVGYVAIFLFAVGGTAIAANTIRSEDIVNGEVHSIDVTNNDLRGADVLKDSLTGADVLEGSLGRVPRAAVASSVAQGGVTTPALRPGAVTPAKLSTFPAVSVIKLAAETTHTAAGTILHADFERYDTDGMHDTSTDTENLVAPVTGTYYVSATVDWDANSLGYRRISLLGSGGGSFASVAGPPLPPPAFTSQNVSGIDRLSAGQAVQVQALQGSTVDLGARIAHFEMAFVGG